MRDEAPPVLRVDYLDRRRPCFLCSRPLARLRTGANRGRYFAAVRMIDGFERPTHTRCGGLLDEEIEGEEIA